MKFVFQLWDCLIRWVNIILRGNNALFSYWSYFFYFYLTSGLEIELKKSQHQHENASSSFSTYLFAYFMNSKLSSCLIWQIISFILPLNGYSCVYAWITLFIENKLWVADHYRAMLNAFLCTKIEEEDNGNICFQQDGSMCHTVKATLGV